MIKLELRSKFATLSTVALGFALSLVLAAPSTANAQTAVCELDWNCDGVVSWDDVYEGYPGGLSAITSRGFYSDVYYYVAWNDQYPQYVGNGYFHEYMQCGTPGNLDWNGDGAIELTDAYNGNVTTQNLNSFYSQWWIFENVPTSYAYYYPNSDCIDLLAPATGCEDQCGGYSQGGSCFCDDRCVFFGDCCDDYEEFCEHCPGIGDDDLDGMCNDVDVCPGYNDAVDSDNDHVPDGCDPCPSDNPDDPDGNGVCGNQATGDQMTAVENGSVVMDEENVYSYDVVGGGDFSAYLATQTGHAMVYVQWGHAPALENSDYICTRNVYAGFEWGCDLLVPAGVTKAFVMVLGHDAASSDYALTVNYLSPGTTCPDNDGDGVCNDDDNCPADANPGQEDHDGDGIGTACDYTPCPWGFELQGDECVDLGYDGCDDGFGNHYEVGETFGACDECECIADGYFACIEPECCVCAPGYDCRYGPNSFYCDDIDECDLGIDDCAAGYECANTAGSYDCPDIDECQMGTDDCADGYDCNNTPGSWNCTDIHECELGIDSCVTGYECVNTPGSYDCNDINECALGTDNCDAVYDTCVNTFGSFDCICIDSDSDGICNIDDLCPNDPFDNCCVDATECDVDEFCEIPVGTCGTDGQCALFLECDEGAAPVCDCDGFTYFNECEAAYADAAIDYVDGCTMATVCTDNADCATDEFCFEDGYCMILPESCPSGGTEVCGVNGVYYENACLANAAGVQIDPTGDACISEVPCNYHADCAASEYCAGTGCGANDGTCDPYLPEGICTVKRDPAECITAPIEPVCGCNAEFYLSPCQMESEGDRFSNAGICAPVSCSALGADHECPCNHSCKEAVLGTFQCLRNP